MTEAVFTLSLFIYISKPTTGTSIDVKQEFRFKESKRYVQEIIYSIGAWRRIGMQSITIKPAYEKG
jgi:hypothetical protein